MKTKDLKLEMIERILNYLDINNKLRMEGILYTNHKNYSKKWDSEEQYNSLR
jgi:hypothetical protein